MNWEVQFLQDMQSIRVPVMSALMESISFLYEGMFITCIISILYWCFDKKIATKIAWIVLLNGIFNSIIKNIVKMPRPFERGVTLPLSLETAEGFSFPSKHVQTAVSFWGGAVAIFKTKEAWIMAIVMSLLAGLTRLYLGLNWPIDIIGSFIIGFGGIIVANNLFEQKFNQLHIIVSTFLIILVYIFPVDKNLAVIAANLFGLIIGISIEQRYINFKERCKNNIQIKKLTIGFLGLIMVYLGLGRLLVETKLSQMILHFLVMLWITAFSPYIYKKILKI
ncbi:MAG: hypothetical protein ATN32_06940 [Candidatus Epulonipiscium fishelsonii]|nr:MAG: hypothetical protein ATN32_06940 [Epulopiscium sp. AS2M-Bin002]